MAITNVSQFASQAPTSSLTGELQGGSAAQLAALAQALSPSGGNGTNQTYGGASGYQGQGTGTLLNTGGENLTGLLESLGSAQPKSYAPSAAANPFGPGTTEQQGLSNYISGISNQMMQSVNAGTSPSNGPPGTNPVVSTAGNFTPTAMPAMAGIYGGAQAYPTGPSAFKSASPPPAPSAPASATAKK